MANPGSGVAAVPQLIPPVDGIDRRYPLSMPSEFAKEIELVNECALKAVDQVGPTTRARRIPS
jgi:hypothetical protein